MPGEIFPEVYFLDLRLFNVLEKRDAWLHNLLHLYGTKMIRIVSRSPSNFLQVTENLAYSTIVSEC